MAHECDTVTLPAYYASAFVNGDFSGLTSEGAAHAESLLIDLEADGWNVVDVARDASGEAFEARFTRSYRLYGGDADGGDVLDYVIYRII